jgi:DNA-binding CsgD family transcriptional regulator
VQNLDKPIVSPVLVGRTQELEALEKALAAVQAGRGQCLVLSGEAGVGKSRLLAEIRHHAEGTGFLIFQGHCFEPDVTFPYAPLIDTLRQFFARRSASDIAQILGPLAAELVKLLPELALILPSEIKPTPTLDPESEKRRLFETLAQVFTRLTEIQPLLIIFEDVHWSDETSLDFLHFLARRLAAFPILLLFSYRPEDVSPHLVQTLIQLNRQRLAQEIGLKRLGRDETDSMLRAIFDLSRPVQTDFLNAIFTLTEGNPFFIEEVLKSLIASGDVFFTGGRWDRKPLDELNIPPTVLAAVQQRLGGLSPAARYLVTLAAIAGRRFDFALLQALTPHIESELLVLVKELMTAQLVVEESAEQFAFRHALIRQAIYTSLLVRERRALHQTMAEMMEQRASTEGSLDQRTADLAYHFYQAEVWDKSVTYGWHAGEQAQRLYALSAAVEHFSQALNAAEKMKLPPPADLYRARSQAYQTIGIFEPARNDLIAALKLARAAHDNRMEWQILLDLGVLWVSRDYQQAGNYFRQALELARTMDDLATLAHSLNRLGNYLTNIDRPQAAVPHHQEALAIFEQLQDRAGLVETLDLLGTTLVAGGDWSQGAVRYQQAAALFRELDNRQGLVSSLTMLTFRGGAYLNDTAVMPVAFAEAIQDGDAALALARQTGQRSAEAMAMSTLAFCLGPQGDYPRALTLAQNGLALAEALEHRHWITFGHLALGAIYLDLLATSSARPHLEQALALAQEIGSRFFHNLASSFLIPACLLDGDLTRAEAVCQSAFGPDTVEEETFSTSRRQVCCARAELTLAQGKAALALDMVDQLIASAANIDPSLSGAKKGQDKGAAIPRLWHLRGEALIRLGRVAEAETVFQAVQETATARGLRSLLWRVQASLTRVYQIQRRRPEAETALRLAQSLIEELAGGLTDEALHSNFQRQAAALLPKLTPLSPRRAAQQALGGLTQRERQVAILIAQGKSNRDIAEALVVSERTAATHVGNILNKLGYTSRAQVAAWVVDNEVAQ